MSLAPEFTALAYLGDSSGDTTFYAGSFDNSVSANSLLQVAGSTTATSTKLPGASTATTLPSGQDNSAASTQRGLLYTLTSNLAKADAISFFGSSVTQSTVKSVQSDDVGGTYVLVDDSAPGTISNQSASFTSAAAVQGQPPNGAALHYAYIAELLGTSTPKTPAPGLTPVTFTADFDNLMINGAPCKLDLACVAANDGSSTISYQWDISPANNAGNVVFNFAAQSELGPTYTITLDGQQASTSGSSLSCVTAQANNGTTCTAPSITAAGSPHTLTLAGKVPLGASTNPITFDGNVADAAGEFVDAKQNQVLVAAPVNIKANITGSTATVDAASGATDTTKHPTVVTYIATVTNQGTSESKYTTLKITLPPAFVVTTLPTVSGVTAPTCDTTVKATGCSSADIPADGVLTYTFTGVYVGSLLSTPNVDGTFTETVKADATALPVGANSESSSTVTTTVRGYAALSLDVEPKTSTHNLSTTATPDNVTITITLSNAGPNESGPIPASAITNTLPATTYFVVSNVTVAAPSAECVRYFTLAHRDRLHFSEFHPLGWLCRIHDYRKFPRQRYQPRRSAADGIERELYRYGDIYLARHNIQSKYPGSAVSIHYSAAQVRPDFKWSSSGFESLDSCCPLRQGSERCRLRLYGQYSGRTEWPCRRSRNQR